MDESTKRIYPKLTKEQMDEQWNTLKEKYSNDKNWGEVQHPLVKKNKKYLIPFGIFMFGIILWLSESAYFGWNAVPNSTLELVCDIVSGIIILIGYFKIAQIFNK